MGRSQGFRSDNPTDHRIERGLPKRTPTRHYRALPPHEVPEAMACIEGSQPPLPAVKLCFRFLVHTAVRSTEARLATWDEVDLENAVWTIPAHRMKSGREHRVPLTADTSGILLEARELTDGSGLVFPSPKRARAITDATFSTLLKNQLRQLRPPTGSGNLSAISVPRKGMTGSWRNWPCLTSLATAQRLHI